MTRAVVVAVVLLAAIAAADAFRATGKHPVAPHVASFGPERTEVHRSSAGYSTVGRFARQRVLRLGREYLSSASIDAAFPSPAKGAPFSVSHLAAAPDGMLALAIYRFPAEGDAQAGIELWRERRLIASFAVRVGAFDGGLGFADGGRLVATVLSDGYTVLLFDRSGKRITSLIARS
jgi:hypothetical protein